MAMEKSLKLYILGSDTTGRDVNLDDANKDRRYYLGALSEKPFPHLSVPPFHDNQIIIGDFEYSAARMGGSPIITATFQYERILDEDFGMYNTGGAESFDEAEGKLIRSYVYTYFNGEKYYVRNMPTRTKSNGEVGYTYDLTFYSEREILNHIFFVDAVQGDTSIDLNKTNSTKVLFFGDIREFVSRLNYSLKWSGIVDYKVVIDSGITSEAKMVSMEDTYWMAALQGVYNIFELPYYFDGKTIHIGYVPDRYDILEPIRYGSTEALLSITRENVENMIINRATGIGSTDNIPFYYPNPTPRGTLGIRIINENGTGITASDIRINDHYKFYSTVSLSDTLTYKTEDITIPYYWESSNGNYYSLADMGLYMSKTPTAGFSFGQTRVKYITAQSNLMPPIYRETDGKELFYNAENDTYSIDGHRAVFRNVYDPDNPLEGKGTFDDIKPTIAGITNSSGQRIDMFSAFAYDLNDSDEIDPETNEYLHPYFFAKLKKLNGSYGFNLFDHAIESQAMQISFTSGICGGCAFEIMVDEDTQENLVCTDRNGNLLRDDAGNVRIEVNSDSYAFDRQQDTINNEVWIALKKDDTTYGQIMPNVTANYKPKTSDTFVILGTRMPEAYMRAAEERLETAIIQYMLENNDTKYNYSIEFSRIFLAENPTFLNRLTENSRILLDYDEEVTEMRQVSLYVSEFTYTVNHDAALPEIKVVLSDSFSATSYSLQDKLNSIKDELMLTVSGTQSYLMEWARYNFLSRRLNDTANGHITFNKGITSKSDATFEKNVNVIGDTTAEGNLISKLHTELAGTTNTIGEVVVKDNRIRFGNTFSDSIVGQGGYINKDARGVLRSLKLWEWLEVPELRYNRVSAYTGIRWDTVGAGIIESVIVNDDGVSGAVYLKLEDGEIGMIGESDLCMGIWHDTSGNSTTSSDDRKGTFTFAGFKTVYFLIKSIPEEDSNGESNSDQHYFTYELREGTSIHPFPMMNFATRGNLVNTDRQSFTYTTTEYSILMSGVNSWVFTDSMYKAISGNLEGFTLNNKNFHGYGTILGNAYIYGQIDQFEKINHEMRVTDSLGGFMEPGETDTLYCYVYDGYGANITETYSGWTIERNTEDTAADATWNAEAGTPTIVDVGDGKAASYQITYSDLGSGISAIFTFTATNGSGNTLSISTSFG